MLQGLVFGIAGPGYGVWIGCGGAVGAGIGGAGTVVGGVGAVIG